MYDRQKLDGIGSYQTDTIFSNELFNIRVLQKFPILLRGNALVWRRDHANNQLYEWAKNKRNEYLEAMKNYCQLIHYERREKYKILLRKYYKARGVRVLVGLAGISIHKNKDIQGSISYLYNALLLSPRIILTKSFLKTGLLSILQFFGLDTILYKIYTKIKYK